MNRFVILSSIACSALLSNLALAQMPPPNAPASASVATDGPGNGLQLDLDVFGFSGSLSIPGTVPVGGAGLPSLVAGSTAAVAAGYYFDQNAVLLDLGFGATSGTNILFEIAPTYRRYFSPLRTGAVTPFAQGGVIFGISAPSGASAGFGLGLEGAAGAEWLFTRNMGLEAAATLGYVHLNASNFNTDTIGLGGKIGLTIHL